MMDMSGFDRNFDTKRMSFDQALDYLWDMFVRPLTRRTIMRLFGNEFVVGLQHPVIPLVAVCIPE
jgi:hypothetical protein